MRGLEGFPRNQRGLLHLLRVAALQVDTTLTTASPAQEYLRTRVDIQGPDSLLLLFISQCWAKGSSIGTRLDEVYLDDVLVRNWAQSAGTGFGWFNVVVLALRVAPGAHVVHLKGRCDVNNILIRPIAAAPYEHCHLYAFEVPHSGDLLNRP